MTCIPKNVTVDAASRAVQEKAYYGHLDENSTQADIMAVYDRIDKDFPSEDRIVEVPYEDIPKEMREYLRLQEGESVQRYKGLWRRATDASSRKWRQGPNGIERSIEISTRPDNIIKTQMGTTVHKVMEELSHLSLATKQRSNIFPYTGEYLSREQIRLAHGLSEQHITNLEKYTEELLDSVNERQKEKDPKGKAKVYLERFVPDFLGDMGMTIDFMALFSDGMTRHYDFKSLYPFIKDRKDKWHVDKTNGTEGVRLSNEDNWLPDYKMAQIIPQLRTGRDAVVSKNLSKGVEHNRAIPIHVQLQLKPEHKRAPHASLKSEIFSITIGEEQDPALTMLAVDEMTGVPELDKKIEIMTRNIHNYQLEIKEHRNDPTKREEAKKKLKAATKFVNNLIVKRDLGTLVEESISLLKRHYKSFHVLENIADPYVTEGGKKVLNRSYLDNIALARKIAELEAYHAVLVSSGEFIRQMGLHTTNKAEYEKYKAKVSVLVNSLGDAIEMMRYEMQGRTIKPTELEAMKDYSQPGFYQYWLRTLGQQHHPAMANLSDRLQQANNKARLNRQDLNKEVEDWDKRFDQMAKSKKMSRLDLFRKLIYTNEFGKKNLHSKYSKKFYNEVEKLQTKGDKAGMTKMYKAKSDAKEIRGRYRESYILTYDPTQEELKAWDSRHNLDNALMDPRLFYLYFDKQDLPEYYTEGYAELSRAENKELMEFWEWWQSKMKHFRNLAGVSEYERIPDNFLPWIVTDVVDMVAEGTIDMAGAREWAEDLFKLKAYDQHAGSTDVKGYVNPATGELLREIPLWFTQPARDKDGNINHKLKSDNLLKSILIFGDAMFTYHHVKNDVEPYIEALKDIVAIEGEKITNSYGKDLSLEGGAQARKVGRDTKTFQAINEHIDFHVYGMKIQDVDRKTAKMASSIKGYQMLKELGFAILAPAGNFVQVETGTWMEGLKGYHFTPQMVRKARKMLTGVTSKEEKELAKALVYFYEPSDDIVNVKAKSLELTAIQKVFSVDSAMLGYRLGENHNNNENLISMLQNYGIDDNGNVKRIKNLGKDAKSLLDRSIIKDGKLFIEGLMDAEGNIDTKIYTKIRNLAIGISRGIKGGKRSDDEIAVNYKLLGNLFMGFKSWMPGMVDERASPIRYDRTTGSVVEGKYTAWFTDMGLSKAYNQSERTMLGLISEVIIPSVTKLMFDMVTFSWAFKGEYRKNDMGEFEFESKHPLAYKVNVQRAKLLFENFKAKYPNSEEIQSMSFEDFLDYKQGQIRALAAELFVITSISAFVFFLKGEDDDGEARYKNNFATRTAFKLMNRARRELSFFLSYNDIRNTILKQPIPQLGLLDTLRQWSINTRDEAGDFIMGEEEERGGVSSALFGGNKAADKKPLFYETFRLLPGHKFFQTFEPFELDKDREV